jgi:uncharacterized protein YndB with AHSA1/START domain
MHDDITRALGAVTREVQERQYLGRSVSVVRLSRTYDTDIADLWNALTSSERIPRWFLPVSGDLRLGGRYQLTGNAGGEITRCRAPEELALTWEFGAMLSWVEVRLRALAPEHTELVLEHLAPSGGEHWDKFGPGAVGVGWDLTLYGLERHLESGAALDPAEAERWSLSAEGKGFARASSAGWGGAAIAAGTAGDVAEARAARTTSFYTGEPVLSSDGSSPR